MSSFMWPPTGGNQIAYYSTFSALPSAGVSPNSLAIALDTGVLYEYISSTWTAIAGAGSILSVGTIDTGTPSANGAQDVANQLILQSASATAPGLVNLTTQTFAGNKTFSGTVSASQLISTVAIGTAPLVVTSTTNVPNLNASLLGDATFAAPGPIGSTTASTGSFTTLALAGNVTLGTDNTYNIGTTSTGLASLYAKTLVQVGSTSGNGVALFPTSNSSGGGIQFYASSGPNIYIQNYVGSLFAIDSNGYNVFKFVSGASAAYSFYVNNNSTPAFLLNSTGLTLTAPIYIGTVGFSDTGVETQFTGTNTGYLQNIIQNQSSGTGASSDIIVSNNSGTATTYYGNFGMNSSTYTGTGSLNLANAVYLYSQTGDLVLGTNTSNAVHLLANHSATDAITINSSNNVLLPALSTAGIVTNSATGQLGSTTAPTLASIIDTSNVLNIKDSTDNTKILALNVSGNTAGITTTLKPTSSTSQIIQLPNVTTTDTLAALGLAQTFSAAQTFSSSVTMGNIIDASNVLNIKDSTDNTKVLAINASGNTTGVTTTLKPTSSTSQIIQLPNVTTTDTLAALGLAQTFSAAQTFTLAPVFSSVTASQLLSVNGSKALTSIAYATAPAASTISEWDANKNLSANAFIPGFLTTATAAGTTSMTIASAATQFWTGSTTQTVKLPTTSVAAGAQYLICNRSSGIVTVQSSGANTIQAMAANTNLLVTALVATPTTAANWDAEYSALTPALSNPMTTLGDTIVAASGGTPARLAVGTNGQYVAADSTATNGLSYQNPINGYNFIVNSGFDYWQAGTSVTLTATGGGTPTPVYGYQADQWYVNNKLGGGSIEGQITYSRQSAVVGGSGYAALVRITTAPTGTGIQNGLELYQVLSNAASLNLYGKTASFSIQVSNGGAGNVNQVGIQFCYATTEAKPTNFIGSEILVSVSSSNTLCVINGQALGTAQGVGGVIGVRIRPTAVSSGNLYDLNNGIQVEQAVLNLGSVAAPWQRQNSNPAQELAACQFFYEKSYDIGTFAGASTPSGFAAWPCYGVDAGGDNVWTTVSFKVPKRTTPSITFYDCAGNSGKVSTFIGAGTRTDNTTGGVATACSNSFYNQITVPHLATAVGYQWIADTRI